MTPNTTSSGSAANTIIFLFILSILPEKIVYRLDGMPWERQTP